MRNKKPYQKKRKRVGRGHGSGHGKTSTKGHKGQRARSGFTMRPGFEGGQTPIYLKLGKRGFNQSSHKVYSIVNIDQLDKFSVDELTPDWLLEQGYMKRLNSGLKVLGRGEMKRKMTVHAHRFSNTAKAAIEKAGGAAVLIQKP